MKSIVLSTAAALLVVLGVSMMHPTMTPTAPADTIEATASDDAAAVPIPVTPTGCTNGQCPVVTKTLTIERTKEVIASRSASADRRGVVRGIVERAPARRAVAGVIGRLRRR